MILFFSFTVNKQHDADELFLSILNLLQQQMDDKVLVRLPSKLVCVAHLLMLKVHIYFIFSFSCLGSWNPEPLQDPPGDTAAVFGVSLRAGPQLLPAQHSSAYNGGPQFSGAVFIFNEIWKYTARTGKRLLLTMVSLSCSSNVSSLNLSRKAAWRPSSSTRSCAASTAAFVQTAKQRLHPIRCDWVHHACQEWSISGQTSPLVLLRLSKCSPCLESCAWTWKGFEAAAAAPESSTARSPSRRPLTSLRLREGRSRHTLPRWCSVL